MNQLFSENKRNRNSHARPTESTYHFLNESNLNWVKYYRKIIEGWYREFPRDRNFYKQFTSTNDQQHFSAFFELFVFGFLKKCGYDVIYHKKIGSRKIDLCFDFDNQNIWIDCTLSGEPNLDVSIKKIESEIELAISELSSEDYWINLNFIKSSHTTPKISSLKKFVNSKITSINSEIDINNKFEWSYGEWRVDISFLKKEIQSNRALGIIGSSQHGGFVDGPSMEILRKTLNAKRGSGYSMRSPYIIAINSQNMLLNEELIKGVLFGSMNIAKFQNNLYVRNPFFYTKVPQNTSASGVLIVHGLYSSNIGNVKVQLWINPWAKYPLDKGIFNIDTIIPVIDSTGSIHRVERKTGRKISNILGVKQHYLD